MSKSTWSGEGTSSEWNDPQNWAEGVPTDQAVFADSSKTAITFSPTDNATVQTIEFDSGAPSYTFTFGISETTPSLTIAAGVDNQSGAPQKFEVKAASTGYKDAQLRFSNSASAGGTDITYSAGPVSLQDASGGGVISFNDTSTASSASFVVRTGAKKPPEHNSTVGGEVGFCDNSTAETASFTIYGTLGTDGDTFGNVVFHDSSTADRATFINIGGTVSGGDGGNTQFYNTSTAASGTYNNRGGTVAKANGGDVAFDGTATGGNGHFYNHAAPAQGAYGGVTSFNNNPPEMKNEEGATAGNGHYYNYGATGSDLGGGGHIEFSAKHGWPTADQGTFTNYGCEVDSRSSAGHTIFSISLPNKDGYYPRAGSATFTNNPAPTEGGKAGFTEFAVYQDKGKSSFDENDVIPTADSGTFYNNGATVSGAQGGYTSFKNNTTAGNATLTSYGGKNGGYGGTTEFADTASAGTALLIAYGSDTEECGGRIVFYDTSSADKAAVELSGNGTLDIGDHTGGLTIDSLNCTGGVISSQLGATTTTLTVSGTLSLNKYPLAFSFWTKEGSGFELGTTYTVLKSAKLVDYNEEDFSGNWVDEGKPTFSFSDSGEELLVTFSKDKDW